MSEPSVSDHERPTYHGQDITKLTTELREYHAIAYEIDMLRLTLIVGDGLPPGTTADALIESFVMHFRTLASFLWNPTAKYLTDALAWHFVLGGQWKARDAKPKELIERVSREVAHLTTFRLSDSHPLKEWTPRECVAALLPTLEQFAAEIDPEKKSPRLKPAVEELRAFHESRDPKIVMILDSVRATTAETTIKILNAPMSTYQNRKG